jgi:hypothetical protein
MNKNDLYYNKYLKYYKKYNNLIIGGDNKHKEKTTKNIPKHLETILVETKKKFKYYKYILKQIKSMDTTNEEYYDADYLNQHDRKKLTDLINIFLNKLDKRKQFINEHLNNKSKLINKMFFNTRLKNYTRSIKSKEEMLKWEIEKHRYFD